MATSANSTVNLDDIDQKAYHKFIEMFPSDEILFVKEDECFDVDDSSGPSYIETYITIISKFNESGYRFVNLYSESGSRRYVDPSRNGKFYLRSQAEVDISGVELKTLDDVNKYQSDRYLYDFISKSSSEELYTAYVLYNKGISNM